jgi:hypothetical protein
MRTDEPMSDAEFQRILNAFPEEDHEPGESTGPTIGVGLCLISAGIVFVVIGVILWRLAGHA